MDLHFNFLIMATRYVSIQSESDLTERWTDSNCPSFEWEYNEQDISECLIVDDGYQASYETLEVEVGNEMSFTYLCEETKGVKTYTLSAGEYGVKP